MNSEIYKDLEVLEDFVKIEHSNGKITIETANQLLMMIWNIKDKTLKV